MWPTAQARDFRSGDSPDSPRQARKLDTGWSQNLNDVAKMMWKRPDVPNGGRTMPPGMTMTGRKLDGTKGSQLSLSTIADRFSHPAPVTQYHGPTLSQLRRIWRPLRASVIASHGRATWRRLWKGRSKQRLNPIFVEWLMGWPPGHALCDCLATEFAHWQQDMRGALSALPTASGAWIWEPPMKNKTPTQMNLF